MARRPILRGRGVRLGAVLVALAVLGNDGCERPGTVYGLTVDSSFVHGCFPPALCPALLADLRGTFRLRELAASARDPFARTFVVNEVFWLVRRGDEDVRVRGWGIYRREGEFAQLHRLTLHLSLGGEVPQIFDSGLVPTGAGAFPEIDARVSKNGERLFDTVFHVRAVPFASREPGRTPCGPGLTCDATTEICVARSPVGPAIVHECQPIPSGCEDDRSCGCAGQTLCSAPFDACFERAANALECVCLQCQ